MSRRIRKAYKNSATRCRRGHPRTPENTAIRPDGDMRCMACEHVSKRVSRYGLNEEQWNDQFEKQGRACAVCGVQERGYQRC